MPEQNPIYVVDDDEGVRHSLAFLLKSAKFKVEAFESADAFLAALPSRVPSCIITDVRMPGMSGLELLKRLRRDGHPVTVIVITGHGDVPLAVEAMKNGAFDFLEKPFDDEVLLKTVSNALNRQEFDEKRAADRAATLDKIASLSPRERQVLDGLVAGLPNKTIAYDLKISPRTVEIYRANLMTKMEADSLSELVRMALFAGVLDATPP
jgi:two-component system, LuxR family, response regulator FixJ